MTQTSPHLPPTPTDQEKEWVRLLATGEKAQVIAEKIGLNKNTFAYKLKMIRAKYNCANTTQLVSYFITNKYIDYGKV
jgi:DNA-binding CsgD family transcriptional regulator